MRALMLTHTFRPSVGGGIRYKSAIVDHFRSLGHQVDVLAVSQTPALRETSAEAGTVTRVPSWLQANSSAIAPRYLAAFRRRAATYDVLHFNFPSPMSELALLANRTRVRHTRKIAMYHADIVPAKRMSGPYNRWVTAPFLAEMDHIVVSSPKLLESSPHLAPVRDRVSVIPFGLRTDDFALEAPPEKPGREGGRLRVLFVGRLSRYKGVDQLLRSVSGAPGVDVRIVGTGPLEKDLKALSRSLSLEKRVVFTGRLSDEALLKEYHGADVLALPSTDAGEAFGYVLIEAMMCGAALVSTELGTGTSFVNQHEETGLVVPPKDVPSLRSALNRLEGDRTLLRCYQDAARARAVEYFTIDRMLVETEKLYA